MEIIETTATVSDAEKEHIENELYQIFSQYE